MSNSVSTTTYGYDDDPIVQTSVYTHDISEKMRVPKRIKATGEYFDDNELLSGTNGNGVPAWNYQNKMDMNVPDRIVVLGQDRHLGTKSAPREIMFDNSVLPKDPGFTRVQTPPRNITLSEYRFPTASEEPQFEVENDIDDYEKRSVASVEEQGPYGGQLVSRKPNGAMNQSFRDGTPLLNSSIENLTPSEELLHLRRQVAKLNRRMLVLEMINNDQKGTQRYLVGVTAVLVCLKIMDFFFKKH